VLFLVYQKQIQQIWFKSLNLYNHDKVDSSWFLAFFQKVEQNRYGRSFDRFMYNFLLLKKPHDFI
jgi:hypothetical protein